MCLCLGVMEDLWKTVSFGGMVDDKKMQTGALWCGLSMGILTIWWASKNIKVKQES